jgi:peptide/nickel transport system substrate-binding protein
MQHQLQKIGMDVKLIVNEDVRGFQKENPKGWHSSVGLPGSLSGTGDYIHPFIRRFTTGGDWNFGKIDHARIDEIGKEIQKTFALDGQYQLLQEAQNILVEDHAFIHSSCFKRFMVVASPAWKNYRVSSYRRHISNRMLELSHGELRPAPRATAPSHHLDSNRKRYVDEH